MDEALLKEIDATTLGIFWFTELPLQENPDFFSTFDYLFEGMLTQHINKKSIKTSLQEPSVFIGKSYNRAIFLAHLQKEIKPKLKILEELIEISLAQSQNKQGQNSAKFKILFINDESAENIQKLKNKFSNIVFKKL
jgi:hypothetical protein